MATAAQKISSSTQQFTEIQDISEDMVIFTNSLACLVVEVRSVNFALLSREEQNAKIYSYASLLNSLSFPIQILIRNRPVDISSYLRLLAAEAQKAQTPQLASYIEQYRAFVQELIRVNSVLDKKFYIVVPYSFLEKGVTGATGSMKKGGQAHDQFTLQAKQVLHTKADALHSQLARIGLVAKTLQKEELVRLYYDIYNSEESIPSQSQSVQDMQAKLVKGQK